MFSTFSELTPRAPIPDGRMAQFMQPWYLQLCILHICKLTCGLLQHMFAQELFLSHSEMRRRVGGRAPSYGDHFQLLPILHLDRATEAYFISYIKF